MLVWFSLRSPGLGRNKSNSYPPSSACHPVPPDSFWQQSSFFNPEKPIEVSFISKPLPLQKHLYHFGSMSHVPQSCLFISPTVFLMDDRGHVSQRIVCLSLPYQKQQRLEQCVHKGRSDNPPVYCFTCHLRVIHSTLQFLLASRVSAVHCSAWRITPQAC